MNTASYSQALNILFDLLVLFKAWYGSNVSQPLKHINNAPSHAFTGYRSTHS